MQKMHAVLLGHIDKAAGDSRMRQFGSNSMRDRLRGAGRSAAQHHQNDSQEASDPCARVPRHRLLFRHSPR